MKTELVKRITIEKLDDGSLKLSIEPISEKKKAGDDEGEYGWCPPVSASAASFEEAIEKIKGVLELKVSEGKKPKNIIAEFLQG